MYLHDKLQVRQRDKVFLPPQPAKHGGRSGKVRVLNRKLVCLSNGLSDFLLTAREADACQGNALVVQMQWLNHQNIGSSTDKQIVAKAMCSLASTPVCR